jgi:thioredoxin-related protein
MGKKLIFFLILAFLFGGACQRQPGELAEKPSEEKVSPKVIIPQKNYALLIVESKSCIYCKQLNKDIETNKNLQDALKDLDLFRIMYENYTPVRANFGGKEIELSERELARFLNALSFPNLVFYDRSGNIILQIPGYLKPSQFVCVIDYVKTGAYQEKDINTYVKEKNC